MKDNDDFLNPFKMRKQKQNEQKRIHQETMKKIAAYVWFMMIWWEDMDVIYAPYHI